MAARIHGSLAQLLTWMRLRLGIDHRRKPQAQKLIGRVRPKRAAQCCAPSGCTISRTSPTTISIEFCDLIEADRASSRTWFLVADHARETRKRAKEVFQAIDAFLPDARSVT